MDFWCEICPVHVNWWKVAPAVCTEVRPKFTFCNELSFPLTTHHTEAWQITWEERYHLSYPALPDMRLRSRTNKTLIQIFLLFNQVVQLSINLLQAEGLLQKVQIQFPSGAESFVTVVAAEGDCARRRVHCLTAWLSHRRPRPWAHPWAASPRSWPRAGPRDWPLQWSRRHNCRLWLVAAPLLYFQLFPHSPLLDHHLEVWDVLLLDEGLSLVQHVQPGLEDPRFKVQIEDADIFSGAKDILEIFTGPEIFSKSETEMFSESHLANTSLWARKFSPSWLTRVRSVRPSNSSLAST